ncbi:MAG: glycosyltransferase family 4 protein [Bacteroidales bacterium]
MKPKILYIAPTKSTFVLKDIKLLAEHYTVRLSVAKLATKPLLVPAFLFIQFFQILLTIHKYQVIIIMFGGYWSLMPTLLGRIFSKKVIVIAGGTDCVSYRSINYGNLRKPILRKIIGWSYSLASVICPVDESLIYFENSYYDSSHQGIKHYFPHIKTRIFTVCNGYEIPEKKTGRVREKNSFISVAFCNSLSKAKLKGLDLIIENAKFFPDTKFTIVGIENPQGYFPGIPGNVYLIGKTDQKIVYSLFETSEFVIQCSISEGFPNALCEAMSMGCIPIVSPVGAMPHIAGDIGFIVGKRSSNDFCAAIQRAISTGQDEKLVRSGRSIERIGTNYSEGNRIAQFVELIDSL